MLVPRAVPGHHLGDVALLAGEASGRRCTRSPRTATGSGRRAGSARPGRTGRRGCAAPKKTCTQRVRLYRVSSSSSDLIGARPVPPATKTASRVERRSRFIEPIGAASRIMSPTSQPADQRAGHPAGADRPDVELEGVVPARGVRRRVRAPQPGLEARALHAQVLPGAVTRAAASACTVKTAMSLRPALVRDDLGVPVRRVGVGLRAGQHLRGDHRVRVGPRLVVLDAPLLARERPHRLDQRAAHHLVVLRFHVELAVVTAERPQVVVELLRILQRLHGGDDRVRAAGPAARPCAPGTDHAGPGATGRSARRSSRRPCPDAPRRGSSSP